MTIHQRMRLWGLGLVMATVVPACDGEDGGDDAGETVGDGTDGGSGSTGGDDSMTTSVGATTLVIDPTLDPTEDPSGAASTLLTTFGSVGDDTASSGDGGDIGIATTDGSSGESSVTEPPCTSSGHAGSPVSVSLSSVVPALVDSSPTSSPEKRSLPSNWAGPHAAASKITLQPAQCARFEVRRKAMVSGSCQSGAMLDKRRANS